MKHTIYTILIIVFSYHLICANDTHIAPSGTETPIMSDNTPTFTVDPNSGLIRVYTTSSQYNIYPSGQSIFCWQKIDQIKHRVRIDFYDGNLLTGITYDATESTDGYLIFENDSKIKIAIHSDGTMWVDVKQYGKSIDFTAQDIDLDYDKGGGDITSVSSLDIAKLIYETNWLVITDKEATNEVETTGGFGIYVRPSIGYNVYGQTVKGYPLFTKVSDSHRTLKSNFTTSFYKTSFIVSLFPAKTTERLNEMVNKRIQFIFPNIMDQETETRSNFYGFPTDNEVRSWMDLHPPTNSFNDANSPDQNTHFFRETASSTEIPTPVTTLVIFEDMWQFAGETPTNNAVDPKTTFLPHAFIPYQVPEGVSGAQTTLNNFLTNMSAPDFQGLDILFYVSAMDEYCQIPRLKNNSKYIMHDRSDGNSTITEQEYYNYFMDACSTLFEDYDRLDGLYIDTLPLNGGWTNLTQLEPMILSYRIMRDLKRLYPNKIIILHSSENPIGPHRVWGGLNGFLNADPSLRWKPAGLSQLDIYAPFIDRYADIMFRGEGYPIEINTTGTSVNPEVADHIKYVVDPIGKSNNPGILKWSHTKWPGTHIKNLVNKSTIPPDLTEMESGTDAYEATYFNKTFPISLPGSASRSAYSNFNFDESNYENVFTNRLIIMNTIYDNYIATGHLIMRSGSGQSTSPNSYQRAIPASYNGPFTVPHVGDYAPYSINNGGYGPTSDYYRPVSVAWTGSNESIQKATIGFSTNFDNGFSDVWSFKGSNEYGHVFVRSDSDPTYANCITMDSKKVGTYVTNELWLWCDFSGESNVILNYDWKEFEDETQDGSSDPNWDGIFISDDGGQTFHFIELLEPIAGHTYSSWGSYQIDIAAACSSTGLALNSNFVIKFQQYDNSSIDGTYPDGYAIDNVSLTSSGFPKSGRESLTDIINEYKLYQNFPNPFNPTTSINYSLKSDGKVHLAVYNVLGQQVITLINKFQLSGDHSIIWDGTNDIGSKVSSGIYFYRLESGDFISERKMLLLK